MHIIIILIVKLDYKYHMGFVYLFNYSFNENYERLKHRAEI